MEQQQQQQQQPTMDPTLLQIMQTLVSQAESNQRLNGAVAQMSELLDKCRALLEGSDITLPEGMKPSAKPPKKKKAGKKATAGD